MATAAENIRTAINNIAQQLADLTANPRPDYTIDGKTISYNAYLQMLMDKLEALKRAEQILSGPYQVFSRGVPK